MDTIFIGVVRSTKTEREKKEVFRRIQAAGRDQRTLQEAVNMFQATSSILLRGSSGFQWEAAKEIYETWATCNVTALSHQFTATTLHDLLDEAYPNGFNAVWIMRKSIEILRHTDQLYEQFCDILQMKATTFIRTHSNFNIVVPFCAMMLEFREAIPRSTSTHLFCNTIISVVSIYTIPQNYHPMEYIAEMNNVIGALLGHIWSKTNNETVFYSLKHVFDLIKLGSSEGKSPSYALAAVVQQFPINSIPRAVGSLLQDPTVQTEHICTALERMISWLQWPGANNIHFWLTGFLYQLASTKRYTILLNITESSIEKVSTQ